MKIVSLPLENAYLRRVVKLGQAANDRPGIFLERSYQNPNDAMPVMESQVSEIEKEIAASIRGVYGKGIKVAGSRNPGGVYSDAAGGAKVGDYTIEASP